MFFSLVWEWSTKTFQLNINLICAHDFVMIFSDNFSEHLLVVEFGNELLKYFELCEFVWDKVNGLEIQKHL